MFRPILLAATAALLAGAAVAQPAGPPPGAAGANSGPGVFLSPSGEPFRRRALDTTAKPPLDQWFEGADTDHDGAITAAEFQADAKRFFDILDDNKDGYVDSLENRYYEIRIAPEILDSGAAGLAPRGIAPPIPSPNQGIRPSPRTRAPIIPRDGAARFTFLNEPQQIRVADTNLDWRVSVAEWTAAATRRFNLLDMDHDGKLTMATLPALPVDIPQRR